jgi:hypothetical protein
MRRSVLIAACVAFASVVAFAQAKPNFSGTWVTVSPADVAGQEQEVRHTPTMLSTGHASEGGGHHATYKLDGSESRNELTTHGEQIVTISKAVWEGNKLIVTNATSYPGSPKTESKSVWSIDPEGRLVIEHTRTVTGQPPFNITLVHKRKDK